FLSLFHHRLGGFFHVLHKCLYFGTGSAKLPRLHAIRKRLRLRSQFALKIAKEFRIVGGLAGIFRAVLLLVPRRRDDIFLALRNLRLVALPAAPTSTGFLRLRVIAL